jgi:hypothetical protein
VEKVKKFGSVALAYIMSGLTTVAGVDPTTLPPKYAAWVGGAGLLLTALHNAQLVKCKTAATAVKAVALFGCTVLMASVLLGCRTTPENAVLHQVAVQYATGKYIESAPEADYADRAQKVIAVAELAQALAADEAVTLDTLEIQVFRVVQNAPLSMADRVLANTLVAAVVAELRARVNAGVLSDQDRYRVGMVLGWVKQAAKIYVPVPTGT